MSIAFNLFGKADVITQGKVVYTTYDKYYIVFDILNDYTFVGINYHKYKDEAAILEIDDVLEVFELPKNTSILLFKKCERIVDKHLEENNK